MIDAVRCALDLHAATADCNPGKERRIELKLHDYPGRSFLACHCL